MKNLLIVLMVALGIQVSYLSFRSAETEKFEKKTEKFIQDQIIGQRMEIEEGKLATTRTSNESIRKYGAWMVEDHENMLRDLKDMAIKKNVIIPFQLPDAQSKSLNKLMIKNDKEFDELFVKMMIGDHKKEVSCLKNASGYTDQDVKAFADRYLPIVEKHLKGIEYIHEAMEKDKNP